MTDYQPSALAKEMIRYLDCPCKVFAPMADDDPLLAAYEEARQEGLREGFTPVLVKVDDTLMECLVMNADEENEPDFTLSAVRAYRARLLSEALPDGKDCLQEWEMQRREEAEDDGFPWDDVLGERTGGEPNDRFSAYWNYETSLTDEVILAMIPTDKAWQVFAWLPMGNWNDCPDTPELMAVAKRWQEAFGAVPACISHDELEFLLPAPVSDPNAAQKLALEQYAFCPDRVEQCEEDGSVGKLADSLTKSTVWYFWWD